MSWFEGFLGGKKTAVPSSEKKEPVLPSAVNEVVKTAKAAVAQQESDSQAADVVLARLRGELPASDDQEHIDIPLVQEERETEALKNELANYERLQRYIVTLRELESAVGEKAPTEMELSQPLFDHAFKQAAAAIKVLDGRSDITELGIFSSLIVVVRDGNLPKLIEAYNKKLQESKERIKELQGNKIVQNTQEAWKRMESNER